MLGVWLDWSVSKDTFCTSTKTWVQIPPTHIKTWVLPHIGVTLAQWEVETEAWLAWMDGWMLAYLQVQWATLSWGNEKWQSRNPKVLFWLPGCLQTYSPSARHIHISHTQKENRHFLNHKNIFIIIKHTFYNNTSIVLLSLWVEGNRWKFDTWKVLLKS